MTIERRPGPPMAVLAAFGARGTTPELLAGGQGTSWRAGSIVLKPVADERFVQWHADLMSRIPEEGFRVARPVATDDWKWVSEGWSASRWVAGSHEHRWLGVIAAGEAFHRGLRDLDPPPFAAAARSPWDVGDRVAWEESVTPPLGSAHEAMVERLVDLRRPVDLEPQLIHGDLTENVLFADGSAPAVIDLAPYQRPVGFASAIVVGDALLWFDGDADLARTVAASVPMFGQLLVRALIYRLVTERLFGATTVSLGAEAAINVASGFV